MPKNTEDFEKCPRCREIKAAIFRKDNTGASSKICVNPKCPLFIDISKMKDWKMR